MEKQMVGTIEEMFIQDDEMDIVKDGLIMVGKLTDFYMDFLEEELGWRENNDWRFESEHDDLEDFTKSMFIFVSSIHLKLLEKKGRLEEWNDWVSDLRYYSKHFKIFG